MDASLPVSRILIIEDDRGWRTLVVRIFRSLEPEIQCLEAGSLGEALRMLERPGLDLVLLDLNLPDCRGLESLKALRQRNWEVAVVVVTGETGEDLALQALRHGAQDYLVKGNLEGATLVRAVRYARERMAAELRLRRSQALFLAISENMVDLLSIVDADGRRFLASPSYAAALGYSPEELARIPMEDIVHPDDLPTVRRGLADLIGRGEAQELEYRLRHRNGGYRVMESRSSRFQSIDGNGFQALVVARDVTGRQRAEQERAELQIQLHQAQKMESVGRLASGIAHEINTPIQFVQVNLSFLKKAVRPFTELLGLYQAAAQALDPATRQSLTRAEENADLAYLLEEVPKVLQDSMEGVERVAKIVRAMKEFSHPGGVERAMLDVNRLAGSAATLTRNEWKYVADLKLELEEPLPPVAGFAAELNQVFMNLIVNAAHAIALRQGEGGMGTITVATASVDGEIEIRVADTGLGIAPEHQSKIFEPFFTTKDVGQGTGQGLTICYQTVVQMHGGRIWFETQPGAGTVFRVRLPIGQPPPGGRE